MPGGDDEMVLVQLNDAFSDQNLNLEPQARARERSHSPSACERLVGAKDLLGSDNRYRKSEAAYKVHQNRVRKLASPPSMISPSSA